MTIEFVDCPFHDARHPDMMIDTELDAFYCLGCHASGDARFLLELIGREHIPPQTLSPGLLEFAQRPTESDSTQRN